MSVTNPSDLFVPEVALNYASQQFVQSLEVLNKLIGSGDSAPIQLMNDPVFSTEGQYLQRPVFTRIGSTLVARRDITSNSTLTPVKLAGANEVGVKLHRRIGPVDVTKDAARLSRATPEEISAEIGKQAGEEFALNMQATIISALIGIAGGVTASAHTSTVWNASTRTNLSPTVINGGLNLMGDQREAFRRSAIMITRSEPMLDLVGDAIGRSYPGVGDQALKGAMLTNTLGMDFAMVDDSALTTADAGFDKYTTLLVGARAMQIWFTLPMTIYPLFQVLDQEQVLDRWRADCDFALSAHGATYDSTNGGANPTNATIATTTNWDPVYSNHRENRVVSIVHNYSGN